MREGDEHMVMIAFLQNISDLLQGRTRQVCKSATSWNNNSRTLGVG